MIKFDWNILWTLINLIIFFVLMKLFLFKPIKKTLDKRKELIDKQFKDAEDANIAAEAKMADYESRIANVEEEAQQIISSARDDAKVEYGKIIDRAQTDADKLKADAKKQIDADIENAKRATKEQMASLAMETAEKVIGKSISAQTDSDIFDEFLNESSDK